MSFYIIIRGPLGCGKSTIAKALSKKLNAKYFAIDKILDEHNLEEWEEGYISQESFIKANEIAARKAKKYLEKGFPVVFDGNFYYKYQIEDLIKRLDFPHYVFTLKAPLKVCIEREKYKIKTRYIFIEGEKHPTAPYSQYKYLPRIYKSFVATAIHGDEVSFWLLTKPEIVILIKSKELAETYRSNFEALWKIAKK